MIIFFFLSDFLSENNLEISEIGRIAVCSGPGNFNGIRASICAMKGVCSSLPIQLIGINKFQTIAKINEPALISLKYRDNKIYWCILKNQETIFMSSSEVGDIKISQDYSDLIVIGYRAEEIATNIKVRKFIEKNEACIEDLLEYSRKIMTVEKFPPKPLYISSGQSLFTKYKGPTILDNPLDASRRIF